jgi:hypothetical protein
MGPAEILARHIASESVPTGPQLHFPLDGHVVRHVSRLLAAAVHLYYAGAAYRRSAKGIQYSFDDMGRSVSAAQPEQEAALQIFDQRIAKGFDIFAPVGLVHYEPSTKNESMILIAEPVMDYPPDRREPVSRRFRWMTFPLDSPAGEFISEASQAGLAFQSDFISVLMLLHLLAHVPATLAEKDELETWGWIGYERTLFERLIVDNFDVMRQVPIDLFSSDALPPTPDAVLAALRRGSSTLWPLRGGTPIVEFSDSYVVDVVSATHVFLGGLDVLESGAGGGALGNIRGGRFEESVRAKIQRTPWAPPPILQKLVGLTVRLNGQDITDLDALAFKGHILFIISCKSMLASTRYGEGTYQTIRNRKSDLLQAVREWKDIVERLSEFRRGDIKPYVSMRTCQAA